MAAISAADLKDVPLLAGLSAEEREKLLEVTHCGEYPPGHVLLEQGKESQRLWIILDGTCEVLLDDDAGDDIDPIVLATLQRHQTFGEMSFFNSAPHSASVRTKNHCKLLYIDRGDYDRLCGNNTMAACKIATNTLNMLAARLRRMDDWVAELVRKQQKNHVRPTSEWSQLRDKLFDWKL